MESVRTDFNLNKNWSQMEPYEFWEKLGNPKYVCAPMVDQSELAFRLITRKYGTHLTFTPMIHSVIFTTQEKYRDKWMSDIKVEDQPCFVQFCGHDPEILLRAAKYVEGICPCIDINLGCPQGIAKRGNYGAFLLEDVDLVLKILGYLSNNLTCAVSCKIRLFPDINKSIELSKNIEKAGVKVLSVHGRTKEQNKHLTGISNWDAIKLIKNNINIPLIANGGLETYDDIQKCFDITGCDAVMSAEKLLENPAFFSKNIYDIDDIALEYIELSQRLENDFSFVRSHLFKFYYQACKMDFSFNEKIGILHTYDEALSLGREIKNFRKVVQPEDKFGWYYRYRKEKLNSNYVDTSYNSITTSLQNNNEEDFDISNMF